MLCTTSMDTALAFAPDANCLTKRRHLCACGLATCLPSGLAGEEAHAAVKSGERPTNALSTPPQVLVHASTGGVGLAAVQVAQAGGGNVTATAGSPAKRAFLRRRGVAAAMGSRDAAFLDSVACAPAGACESYRRAAKERIMQLGCAAKWCRSTNIPEPHQNLHESS